MRDELLQKIFEEIIYYEEDVIEIEREISKNVDEYLKLYPVSTITNEEALRDITSGAIFISQAPTFWLGVKYALKHFKF